MFEILPLADIGYKGVQAEKTVICLKLAISCRYLHGENVTQLCTHVTILCPIAWVCVCRASLEDLNTDETIGKVQFFIH